MKEEHLKPTKIIKEISFPNTVADKDRSFYSTVRTPGLKIERFTKNGEMASVGWFGIVIEGEPVAEIKESVCDIYY